MTAAEATVEAGRELYWRLHGNVKPKPPAAVPAEPVLPGDVGSGNLADGAALYRQTQTTP